MRKLRGLDRSELPGLRRLSSVMRLSIYVFSNFWLIFGKLWEARPRLYRRQILQVNTKYSCESSWRDLQYLHTFAPLESNWKTMKSASGKRPPDEAHGPGKEAIRPQQRLCTAPHSKPRLNFVKRFHMFAVLLSQFCLFKIIFACLVQISPI